MSSLEIVLVKATGLPNVDKFGKSDPYCSVTFRNDKQKTKVIDDNLDPVWNETLRFVCNPPLSSADKIEIKVIDKDNVTPDTMLGYVNVEGRLLLKGAEYRQSLILLDKKDTPLSLNPKRQGVDATLDVIIRYTPPAQAADANAGGGTVIPQASSSGDVVVDVNGVPMAEAGGVINANTGLALDGAIQTTRRRAGYSTREQDFQIRVKVCEARQIQGANIDPVCKVVFMKETKQTRIIRSSNSPCWNQVFYFNVKTSLAKLIDEMVSFGVYNSQSFRFDALIGTFKFDCGLAYDNDKHALLNKWLLLSDPEDSLAGAKGYLKVSILILGPGDEAVSLKANETKDDDIESNLLRPAGVALRQACYEIKIYEAEDLPRMDAGVMNKVKGLFSKEVSNQYVDPYVVVNFAGKELKTKHLEGTDHPVFNEVMHMHVQFPSMCETVKVTLFDWDRTSKDDSIGTLKLDVGSFMQTRDDKFGFLPTFGPCYVNLYGSPREYSDLPNEWEDLNLGKGEGVAYRGRILMELSTEFTDDPEEDHVVPIDSDMVLKAQKFMRRRHYVLHANFMMASMVGDCDGPVQFEVSIGNYGNILEDRVAPAASTTQPTNAVFDGHHYYFLPWGENKPTTCVEAHLEDITSRLFALNMLMKIKNRLDENIEQIKLFKAHNVESDVLDEQIILAFEDVIVGLNVPLPTWDPQGIPMNNLDTKLNKLRVHVMKEIKAQMIAAKSKVTTFEQAMEELERAANQLNSITQEPQNSIPDVIIWMLVGRKRIACTRIKAHEILHAENEMYRGEYCGMTRTLKLQEPRVIDQDDKEEKTNINALLRCVLWFGLEKDDEAYHKLPEESTLQIVAETYENQACLAGTWSGKTLVGVPDWSDCTGKFSLPKDAFQLPESWLWDGDWFLSPELSLSFRPDTGLSEYTEELYYHEVKGIASGWTVDSSVPYTDVADNATKGIDQFKLPEGWEWSGEWDTDFNRPCDEDGWEYSISESVQGYVAVEKVYHMVRRKRLVRKRVLNQAMSQSKDTIIHNLMMKKQVDRVQLLKQLKGGVDENWEFALTYGSKFHLKEKKIDCVRRRRWHRRLKPATPESDPCIIMSIGHGDEKKKKVESMAVPRMFMQFPTTHKWHLRAYMFQARELLAGDSSGFSDPYALISFAYLSQETCHIHQTLCPTWDQTLIFNSVELHGDVQILKANPPPVVMEIYDEDKIGKDEYLGRCFVEPIVKLSAADQNNARLSWHKIKKGSRDGGEVLAAFELILLDSQEAPLPPPRRGEDFMVPHGIRPILQLTRVEILCWGVRNMMKYQLSSVNNPAVVFEIGDKFVESDVLKNAKYNSNFVNNKLTLDVLLPVDPTFIPPLNIRVKDHRQFGRKPIVGCFVMSDLASYNRPPLSIDSDPLKRFPMLCSEDPPMKLQELSSPDGGSMNGDNTLLIGNAGGDGHEQTVISNLDNIENARSKKEKMDLSQMDEDIDWWSKYHASRGHYNKCRKYREMGYDNITLYNTELESAEADFKNFDDLCMRFSLTRGKNVDDDDDSYAGEFKGNFYVYPLPEDPKAPKPALYLDRLVPKMEKLDCTIRVYIVRAIDLQPNDPSGLADPYIVIKAGQCKMDSKKNYVPNNLNPDFGRMFEFKAAIPRDKDLIVQVYDYDLLSSDDMIGQTEIDLENRMLTKFRATCGLPQSYCISGPCQWRDQRSPCELLTEFCQRNQLPEPFYDMDSATYRSPICRIGMRTYVLNQLERGIPPNPHLGPAKERLSLYVLNSLPLVKEHVETRKLYSPLQPGIEQGKIEMWVDIFPNEFGEPGPPYDISVRKPKEFELRVIIWNTTEVILDETSITGEKMSDIYVKGWISGIDERQETDVHYRSMDGDGNFNWRFIFPFQYIPAENMVVVSKKESLFSLDMTSFQVQPMLIVQVWDNDKFSMDDFLGTLELNLSSMPTPAKNAKKCDVKMMDPHNKERKMMNLFECNRAYGFWPFINDETGEHELTGKVEMELELVSKDEVLLRPCGRGRDEPNENPHLDPPKRPETSFFWFTSPWKTFKFIIWRKFKKLFITLIVVILVTLLLVLFIYAVPGLVARKMVGV